LKKTILAKVLSNVEIAPKIHKIELERKNEFGEIMPGQFLHIKCGQEAGTLLRRPISISHTDESKVRLIVRNAGKGSYLLCKSEIGQTFDVLGPLGNGFAVQENYNNILVVGGGIGIAPLVELVKRVSSREVTALLGYKDKPFMVEEFEKHAKVMIATEDGSSGHKGFINDLVKAKIQERKPDILYACGPGVMLKEIQNLCKQNGVVSQFSMEERMACGVGACLVCACKLQSSKEAHGYAKACKDGPVFSGDEVIFDE